jgi:hypothetical protein
MDQTAKKELRQLTDALIGARQKLRRAHEQQARMATVKAELKKPIPAQELIEKIDNILSTPGPSNAPMAAREDEASVEIWRCAEETAMVKDVEEEAEAAALDISNAPAETAKAFDALVDYYRKHPGP